MIKQLEIYEPALCCPTGVCGAEVDPALIRITALVTSLETHGIKVNRYNLAHQPLAFVRNTTVKNLLEKRGLAALPCTFINEKLYLKGTYPTAEDTTKWQAALSTPTPHVK